jgi:hypothetical protein
MRSRVRLSCLTLTCLPPLALLLSACPSDQEKEEKKCEGYISTPSAGFPSFIENPADASPSVSFQVCDSKAVDLNGDGLLDFITADHINPGFGYFMSPSDGDPPFEQGVSVPFVSADATNSAGIVAADYNGDGIPDVANSDHGSNHNGGAITVRINATPVGASIDAVSFPETGETTISLGLETDPDHVHGFAGVEGGLISADFNGDGKVDIATANLSPTAADGNINASFLLNTTQDPTMDGMGNSIYPSVATFAAVQNVELPAAAISIDSADFNGDGKPDVVTSNTAGSSLSILTNMTADGSATISFPNRLDLTIPAPGNDAGAGPTNPVAADFNGDGKPDVASANWNVDTVTIFTNTTPDGGTTSFTADPFIVELCFNPLVLRTGDLDNDGDLDLAIVPLDILSQIAVALIENQTEAGSDIPQFALVDIIYLPERMHEVTFADWLFGGSGNSPDVWFTSTGNIADFDNDGSLDIVAAVAKGGFSIEAQAHLQKTDNILEYVQPPVSLAIANIFLPRHTEVIQLVQE